MMDMEKEVRSVSEATLRRLPAYYRYLRALEVKGRPVVSCSKIGADLNLDPTQVRKDLAATGIVGTPKVGFEIARLIESIEGFLGWNDVNQAFLVGVGSLGTALLGFERFNAYGLRIVAAFDSDPAKAGTEVHGRPVFPMDKLTDLAIRMHVMVGIIAVPAEEAQAVAGLMVMSGIRAIWNLAPVHLETPESVIVQREDLFASLAVLSRKLETMLRKGKTEERPLAFAGARKE